MPPTKAGERKTKDMSDVECPYCEQDFDLNPDDPEFYQEDHGLEIECPECEKKFMIYASCTWSWEGQKADCLNGSDHKWQQMIGAPREYFENRERCADCDEERVRP